MQKLKTGCSIILLAFSLLVVFIFLVLIIANANWNSKPMSKEQIQKRLIGTEWIHDEYPVFPMNYRKIYFVDDETAILSFRFTDTWDGYGNRFERPWQISENDEIELCSGRNPRYPCEHWLTIELTDPFGSVLQTEGNLHILDSNKNVNRFYHQDFAEWYFFAPCLNGLLIVSLLVILGYGFLYIKRKVFVKSFDDNE